METVLSRWSEIGGARVHWVDHGWPATPQALVVCVHGLGGATVNWDGVAPLLTGRHRVVALDLPGFGRTDPGSRSADLDANAELLGEFVDLVAAEHPGLPVVPVGNSMGGLLCVLLAARRPDLLAALVLVDPALPSHRGVPGPMLLAGLAGYGLPVVGRGVAWGRRRLRTPQQLVGDTLRLCCADPAGVDADLVARHVELARVRVSRTDLDLPFEEAARSLMRHLVGRGQALASYRAVPQDLPVLMVHGTKDRLVPYAAALAMAAHLPHWSLTEATGMGHVPQLEDPSWLAGQLLGWLDRLTPRTVPG